MRDRAYLDFVRDRVMAHVRANPSVRPYLGEAEPQPANEVCQRGHTAMIGTGKRRRCAACQREGKRRRRARS